MSVPSSPAAWRRWLAYEMRRLRTAADLEQAAVASRLRCTVTKVSYCESGERSFRLRDLDEVLLPLYGVAECERPQYIEACERSREKGWWEGYDEDILATWIVRYIGLEQGASELRTFGLQYVDGLFQCEGYAAALMRGDPAKLTDEEIAGRLEVRRRRRGVLARPKAPLAVHYIADEAVLRRVVGGPDVMRAQLDDLVALSVQPNVTLQVLPFGAGSHPDLAGSFTVLRFPWAGDPGLVYVEGRGSASYLEREHEVEDHVLVFEHLSALALSPNDSIAIIRQIADQYR